MRDVSPSARQRPPTQKARTRWHPPKVRPSLAARVVVLGLVFVLLLLIAFLGIIRHFGLPEQATSFLKAELQRQGIEASFGKLYLDPLGRVVGRDVEVAKFAGSDEHRFSVERVRFDLNWMSWWRGDPVVSGVVLEEASLRYTLAEDAVIELNRVRLNVGLGQRKVVIRSGRFFLGPVEVRFSGVVRATEWKLPEAAPPLTDEERMRRAATWRKVESVLARVQGRSGLVLHLEADVDLDDLPSSRGRLWMDARQVVVDKVDIRKLALSLDYADERAELSGVMAVGRGQLEVEGLWFWDESDAKMEFRSNLDLSLIGLLVPGRLGEVIAGVEFGTLPLLAGEVEFQWADGFRYMLRMNADWRDFRIQDAAFDRFQAPISFDGQRLLVTDLQVENQTGKLALGWFMDESGTVQGKVESSLDPTTLRQLFGPGAQPFFQSLQFSTGPEMTARITGSGLNPDGWVVQGKLRAVDFRYKGVPFQEMAGDFIYSTGKLYSPNVLVRRPEGRGQAEVWHDFRNEMVFLKNGRSTLNPGDTATVFGDVFATYVTPYRFLKAPTVKIDGLIDLKTQQKTDLMVSIEAPDGMDFDFLGKEIRAEALEATLTLRGPRLEVVPKRPVRMFGGQLLGPIRLDLSHQPARFRADLELQDWQFDRLMRTYFGGEDDLGGKLSGTITVEGSLDVMDSITGGGQLSVRDGALYRIPIYGAFSQVLNVFIPGLGFAKASNAKADFRFEKGSILIDSVDIFSLSAVMIGKGRYDYIHDNVDMDMRVNVRGPIGLVFFPVSKLFEYHGTGPLNDTKWEAKIFE
ncbi:MAG: hypothetical protein OHK005_17810 [Candidatus Methylacidiphilales bacterium]